MDVRDCLMTLGLISRRATRRTMLQPELVEEALRRMGDRRLTYDEQMIVLRATASPQQVHWPDWWEVKPR